MILSACSKWLKSKAPAGASRPNRALAKGVLAGYLPSSFNGGQRPPNHVIFGVKPS